MQNKRRLPILALTLVAFASAAPQEGAPPARLGNDFVYRVLAKPSDENVSIMPGGPLVALADLGAAGYDLPEAAQKRIGGSTEAADKLARTLGLTERNFSRAFPLNHARSAWLSEAPAIQVETVQVRPASSSKDEASEWLDRASRTMRVAKGPQGDSMEAPKKPAGLATVSTLNAEKADGLYPVPPTMRIRFSDKPVETLYGTAARYSEDTLAQTALIPIAGGTPYMLAILLPKDDSKLDELMPEVGARIEQVTAAEEIPARIQMPRIVQTTDIDVADALGLGKSDVSVPTRTGFVIGRPYIPPRNGPGGGIGGGSVGIRMSTWHPIPLPSMNLPGGGRTTSTKVPKEPPLLIANRPFVYAIMDAKTRTILLAGVVRHVEPVK